MNYLIENTLYDATDLPAKQAFLADAEKVTGAFLFNFLGTLGAIDALKAEPTPQAKYLNYLKKDKKLRISSITDDNLDISLSVKLLSDAGYFKKPETAAQITRFLVKLKTGDIKSINSDIVHGWLDGLNPSFRKDLPVKLRAIYNEFRETTARKGVDWLPKPLKRQAKKYPYSGEFAQIAKITRFGAPRTDKMIAQMKADVAGTVAAVAAVDAATPTTVDNVVTPPDADNVPTPLPVDDVQVAPEATVEPTVIEPIIEPDTTPRTPNGTPIVDSPEITSWGDLKVRMKFRNIRFIEGLIRDAITHRSLSIDYLAAFNNLATKYPDNGLSPMPQFVADLQAKDRTIREWITDYRKVSEGIYDPASSRIITTVEYDDALGKYQDYKQGYMKLFGDPKYAVILPYYEAARSTEVNGITRYSVRTRDLEQIMSTTVFNKYVSPNATKQAEIATKLFDLIAREEKKSPYLYILLNEVNDGADARSLKASTYDRFAENLPPELAHMLSSVEKKQTAWTQTILDVIASTKIESINKRDGEDAYIYGDSEDKFYKPSSTSEYYFLNKEYTHALYDLSFDDFAKKFDWAKIKAAVVQRYNDVDAMDSSTIRTSRMYTEFVAPFIFPANRHLRHAQYTQPDRFKEFLVQHLNKIYNEVLLSNIKASAKRNKMFSTNSLAVMLKYADINIYMRTSLIADPDLLKKELLEKVSVSDFQMTIASMKKLGIYDLLGISQFDGIAGFDFSSENAISEYKTLRELDSDSTAVLRYISSESKQFTNGSLDDDTKLKVVKHTLIYAFEKTLQETWSPFSLLGHYSASTYLGEVQNLSYSDRKELVMAMLHKENVAKFKNHIENYFKGQGSQENRQAWLKFILELIPEMVEKDPALADMFFEKYDHGYTNWNIRNHLTGQDVMATIVQKSEIKPMETITKARLKTLLKYNSLDYASLFAKTGLKTRKKKGEGLSAYITRIKKEGEAADNSGSFPQLQVVDAGTTPNDNAQKSFEIAKTDNGRHGNFKVKVLKQFDVHLPSDQFDAFKEAVKDNADANSTVVPAFHGTGGLAATMILRVGFTVIPSADSSTTGRMLGDGIYFSNIINKVAQYVGNSGFGRQYGTTGYVFDMQTNNGPKLSRYGDSTTPGHRSAGTDGRDGIRSGEWAVTDPMKQLKIVRAYEVVLVSPSDYARLQFDFPPVVTESTSRKSFKSFSEETVTAGRTQNVFHRTYTFFNSKIPVITNGQVTGEASVIEIQDSNVYPGATVENTAQGAAISFPVNSTRDVEMIDVLSTRNMERNKLSMLVQDVAYLADTMSTNEELITS